MRLRTLLFLAFALLALLPLAVTVPLASRRIEQTFARELATRADTAAALATAGDNPAPCSSTRAPVRRAMRPTSASSST